VGIAKLGTPGEINRFILLDHLRESFAHLGFSLQVRALITIRMSSLPEPKEKDSNEKCWTYI
jgi:hypothetical protein